MGTREFDLDRRRAGIFGGGPTLAATSPGTGRLLLFPVDRERVGGEAVGFTGQTMEGGAGGTIELDVAQNSALDQKLGIGIPGVDQVAIREQVLVPQSLVAGLESAAIGGWGRPGSRDGKWSCRTERSAHYDQD